MYSGFSEEFQEVEHNLRSIIKELPDNVQASIDNTQEELGKEIGTIISTVSELTVDYAGNIAKNLPNALISTIFTLLSSYFFIADRNRILEFGRKHTPKMIQDKWRMLAESFKKVFSGYFKAQFKIMLVVFAILLVGLGFLGTSYFGLAAFLIAFLDFLPFFGTGTAMIPWAIYEFFMGDYKMTAALVIIYVITQGHPILDIPESAVQLGRGMLFGVIPFPTIAMIVFCIVLAYVMRYTPFGRNVYAVGGNEEAARIAGIKTDNVTINVYGISAVMASIGGILITCRLGTAQPTVGSDWVMPSVTAAAIGGTSLSGGRGSILGALIGGCFMGVVQNAITILAISAYWEQVITGAIILIAIAVDCVKSKRLNAA